MCFVVHLRITKLKYCSHETKAGEPQFPAHFLAAGYFASVFAAVESPSRIVEGISGPGKTTIFPGPGLVPLAWIDPQSCAAWRTKGSGFAQPLILEAIVRIRSV